MSYDAAYHQAYRETHREERKAQKRRYYEAHRAEILLKQAAARDPVAKAAYDAVYRERTRDVRLAKVREYYRTTYPVRREQELARHKAYRQANPEILRAQRRAYVAAHSAEMREYHRAWRRANPEQVRASWARRRARVAEAGAGPSAEALACRWAMWGGLCWMCGAPATETDHVKPLGKGGSGLPANLRPACRSCNRRKCDKWPLEVAA